MLKNLEVIEKWNEINDDVDYVMVMGNYDFMGGGIEVVMGSGKKIKDYIYDFFDGNIDEFEENGEDYFGVFEV